MTCPSTQGWMSFSREGGRSLIELMVALALIAIIFTYSLPSLSSFIDAYQVRRSTEQIMALLNYAKSHAYQEHRGISLCPCSESSITCSDWSSAWTRIVVFDLDTQELLHTSNRVYQHVYFKKFAAAHAGSVFTFTSKGRATSPSSLEITLASAESKVVVSRMGRIRLK